ncbi:RIP homotypic interaction motif-containing protein [Virgisporangium ochraceum]|nr:RIP homotypic interaction motif-containing protein [Virgisporangium ochraceum]
MAEAAPTNAGKYTVTVTGSQGVQVGDSNTQTNTFGPLPPR